MFFKKNMTHVSNTIFRAFTKFRRATLDKIKDRIISSCMIYGISITCDKVVSYL